MYGLEQGIKLTWLAVDWVRKSAAWQVGMGLPDFSYIVGWQGIKGRLVAVSVIILDMRIKYAIEASVGMFWVALPE